MLKMRRWVVESDGNSEPDRQSLVCDSCVRDVFLSRYIKKVGKATICDYCWSTPKSADVRCIPLRRLVNVIRDGITWAYGDDVQAIIDEYSDIGYPLDGIVFDTHDLVVKEIGLEADGRVLHDLIAALPRQQWCRRNPQGTPGDVLSWSWKGFVDKVKYETRYLFTIPEIDGRKPDVVQNPGDGISSLSVTPPSISTHSPNVDQNLGIDDDSSGHIPAYRMLDAIGQLANRMHLVRSLKTGTPIYRARVKAKNVNLVGPKDLGPPPREHSTRPNRMSPAGIVMFYGAMDRNTALVETFTPDQDKGSNVWVARFETMRRLHVLDLSALPSMPSIFDPARRHVRDRVDFLYSFVKDLKQPVKRGDEHINYVPTQIVTEYFRHRFRTITGRPLDGILYPTSRRERGTACVLFIDGYNCGVLPSTFLERIRFLNSPPKQVLRLCDGTEVLDGANSETWIRC